MGKTAAEAAILEERGQMVQPMLKLSMAAWAVQQLLAGCVWGHGAA
jgi:hypothetical protein